MNKIAGVLGVGTVVVLVIVMASLLPILPWFVISLVAIGIGAWRVGWFIDWLERRDSSRRPD